MKLKKMKFENERHEENIIHSLKTIIKHALVKKFLQGNDRPCDNNDFLETKKTNEKLTSDIQMLVESLVSDIYFNDHDKETATNYHYSDIDNELLILILILCGQNHGLQFWNTTKIVRNCDLILSQILKLFDCKRPSELISKNCKGNLTKNILETLCTDLTKSEWKNFPASVFCYQWILLMINQPELSKFLQFILPPALLLIDDFVTENRIIGAQCLHHIIKNVTIAELQFCGYGEIIYTALMPLLRVREASLIQSIIPPLVSLTTKLEFDVGKKHSAKWSKFDNILEIYLENMELEQIIDLRSCYISHLSFLIRAVGHDVMRWTKRLLRIFNEYIQTSGKYQQEKITEHCVKAIETYIELSREVTSLYGKHLLFTLLMALQSTSNCCNVNQNHSEEIIIRCIKIIIESFSKTKRDNIKNDLQKNLACSPIFLKFYTKVDEIFQDSK